MRQVTFSTLECPTESKARLRLQEELPRINDPETFRAHNRPTFGLVVDRFSKEERLEEIVRQRPGEITIKVGFSWSTAAGYRSYLKEHVRPKWENRPLSDIKALEVCEWLKSLPLALKTRAHVRALMHLLFERAMLWGLMDLQRNPVELVKLRGTSRRLKRPQIISPGKFQELAALLREPYKTMAIVAMCTGMRVSEVLALRWEHINFEAGAMMVQQGVVNGRIGRVKTEASQDEIPLDSAFAHVLRNWRGSRTEGLVFPSPVTGGCFYAGMIQRQIVKPKGVQIGIVGLGWQTHVSLAPRRNGCARRCPAEADASQQRGDDYERVRQRYLAGEEAGELQGCADGNEAGTAAN
jgi:integrase